MTGYTLRLATPKELDKAIAIDDAASLLFAQAGLVFSMRDEHPFVQAERAAWSHAIEQGQLWFACHNEEPIGFSALGQAGNLAYLEQLAVHPDHGRRGVGTRLLEAASEHAHRSGASELWLTTYAHIPWNGPYYERHGFNPVPESQCSPQLQAILADQRTVLPAPTQRIAMVRKLR